ncbi:hypothetical protein LVN87_000253 [Listeria monocytogenes]|nr:hypothetical protein [Listeria monocytogenes]EIZ3590403.1 hypothetical protein [Listeria monocytogenes]
MIEYDERIYKNIVLFNPFIKIRKVQNAFKQIRIQKEKKLLLDNTFKEYNRKFRENNNKSFDYASKSLAAMVKNEILTIEQIDEILFIIAEESLFNSYIYKLSSEQLKIDGKRLINWKLPTTNKILENIGISSNKDFKICGYRLVEDTPGTVESLRLLLIDSKILQKYDKEEDKSYNFVFPTLVEYDFRRQLLHIRTQEINNIINTDDKFKTASGRIKNTLAFIDSFKNPIKYKNISNFKEKLFNIEENLLKEVRNKVNKEIDSFKEPINVFCKSIDAKYKNKSENISTADYVKTSIQTIIAMNIDRNPLGDITGIKFRNKDTDDGSYSEISIRDKKNHCISVDNLYWLNLAVLLDVKSVEFMKLVLYKDNLTSLVNLDYSLGTGNIKLLKNTAREDGTMPSQFKYDSVLNELVKFI